MSESWAKNMVGYTPWLTEEVVRDIPNPEIELGIHVTTKTVQAGSLIGGVLVGPLMKMMAKTEAQRRRWSRAGIRGAAIGLLVGPAMTYGRIMAAKIDQNGAYDRCYRLRHNHWQLIFDRATYVGALAGGALFGLTGVAFGINMAVLSVFAFKNGLPLLQSPPAGGSEPVDSIRLKPSKTPTTLPNFTVKDALKTPKDAYKGDCKTPSAPGQCTCECHLD